MSSEAETLAIYERENSNLRRHLLWAANFMSAEQKCELSRRIRAKLEDGGVDEDSKEDEAIERRNFSRDVEKLCDVMREIAASGRVPPLTECHKLEAVVSRIMEYLPKTHQPSLAFIRELEAGHANHHS